MHTPFTLAISRRSCLRWLAAPALGALALSTQANTADAWQASCRNPAKAWWFSVGVASWRLLVGYLRAKNMQNIAVALMNIA
jgi:hypothetical protein